MEPQARPIRAVVCDDGGRTRSDWARMVEIAGADDGRPLSTVTFADTATAALKQIAQPRKASVDVILIDLVMPVRAREGQRIVGPWIARALSQAQPGERHPGPPALILWTSNPMKNRGCETHSFIHLGGHQVIDKEDAPEQQVAQLRAFSEPDDRPVWQPPADGLTPEVRRVLPYLETGMTYPQIGEAMRKGARRIEDCVREIRDALGGVPRGEVVVAAKDAGWTWVPLRFLEDPGSDPFALAR